MKKCLCIAGSDCSGGAGIQADLKTFSAHGVFGMSVIVSVVAENTSRVIDIQNVMPDMIRKQMDAVFEDIGTDAVKVGMLSSASCMEAVAEKLSEYKPSHIVVDPVMYAKNGCPLMDPQAIETLTRAILPLADVLTPNIPEAERIAEMRIKSLSDMEAAARKICAMGCKAVVVKGGHAVGHAVDVLFDGKETSRFGTPRINTKNTHGTGCTFSSAITAQLARGIPLKEAVEQAKRYVTSAIKYSLSIGKGNGPTHHFYELYRRGLFPEYEPSGYRRQPMKPDYTLCLVTERKRMSSATLSEAVEKAVSGGCTMVQLREKELCASDFYQLALDIKEVTKRSNVPLIINDRLDIALAIDADGVHIGQSDLPIRAARRLLGKDKLLGVSVASVGEAIQAQEDGADYLGVGAIFSTKTKKDAKTVAWDELRRIRESVGIPIIVIGGINKNNAACFRELKIDGLAVISAVIAQPDIEKAARELKRLFLKFQ